jgi:hypothetical protein
MEEEELIMVVIGSIEDEELLTVVVVELESGMHTALHGVP